MASLPIVAPPRKSYSLGDENGTITSII